MGGRGASLNKSSGYAQDICSASDATAFIRSGECNKRVNPQSQARHLLGKGYVEGRSYLYGSYADAINLATKYAGTGTPIMSSTGKWTGRERIAFDRDVGVSINKAGVKTSTNAVILHYAKTGIHIVPANRR